MRAVLRLLLAIVLCAGLASAQEAPKRVALVIANATYANAGQLANPPNDARLVAAALRQAGFSTVDLKPDLTVADFRAALRAFRSKSSGAQVALVYYAGHGIEANGRNWLIPVDAQLNSDLDLPDEAIDLDRVMDDVRGADLRVVILDACRNNPFGRSWRSGSRAVTRGLGGVDADDVLVIYAAAPGQTASDGTGGNSPFATALARRLPQADLPIQLLGGAVRDDVLAATGGGQRPFVSASITGTPFYLVHGLGSQTSNSNQASVQNVVISPTPNRIREILDGALDPAKLVAFGIEAASAGQRRDGSALLLLGNRYDTTLRNSGRTKDDRIAIALYEASCAAGDMRGCQNVGFMLIDARGADEDDNLAFEFYKIACDGGNMSACNNLGTMYEKSKGVARDFGQARNLYLKSCRGGDALGCNNVGSLYVNARGVEQDIGEAVSWYRRALAIDPRNKDAADNLRRIGASP